MTVEEAAQVIARLKKGSRLLIGIEGQVGDHEITVIEWRVGAGFDREDIIIPGDANTPSSRSQPRPLTESDLVSFLVQRDFGDICGQLTRLPKPVDHPVEVVESEGLTRTYKRLCGMQTSSLGDLEAAARREGGDALLDVRTHVLDGEGIPEELRGTVFSATVIAWVDPAE